MPVTNDLFEVNDTAKKISEECVQTFHMLVEKLLFMGKIVWPDILTSVAFLKKRFSQTDVDDEKKLVQLLRYLQGSRDLVLVLDSNGSRVIKCWVDAAFAVHHDIRFNTGGTVLLGKGVIYSTTKKQKLNMKISNEFDLVGVDDLIPQILWMLYFLWAQRFNVMDNIVYQDNQISMKLVNHG